MFPFFLTFSIDPSQPVAQNSEYVNIDKIRDELDNSKKIFKENNWPTIDVTRKSVEETAASVIKIYEIKNKKNA